MKSNAPTLKPALVFYSYSHEDEKYLKALSNHLKNLERQGVIQGWSDREIVAGNDWREAINEQLDAADIILLLISMSFISSDFCWGEEMTRALKRHESGEARVIPVIVRPGDYTGARFKEIKALPKDSKAITLWPNRDLAWLDVANGIRKAVEELKAKKSPAAKKPSTKRATTRGSEPMRDGAIPALRQIARANRAAYHSLDQSSDQSPTLKALADCSSIAAQPASNAGQETKTQRADLRAGGSLSRAIYDAKNKDTLPGEIVRVENGAATRDAAVNEAYDALGLAYNFFWDVFSRDSIDGKGAPLEATVHYGVSFTNAFWTGKYMVFGDGDDRYFNRFTITPDIAAKEFAMGIVQAETKLEYYEQPGCIYQSFAIVLAALVKQYALGQKADEANWLIGEGLLNKKVKGRALISLAEPGTAYDDHELGKDPQPAHMRDYVNTQDDNGGIHINSGILNRAFYLTAVALGGYAWEKAGRIWYEAMKDKQLKPKSQFDDLARITLACASRMYGRASDEAQAVKSSWEMVGINTTKV